MGGVSTTAEAGLFSWLFGCGRSCRETYYCNHCGGYHQMSHGKAKRRRRYEQWLQNYPRWEGYGQNYQGWYRPEPQYNEPQGWDYKNWNQNHNQNQNQRGWAPDENNNNQGPILPEPDPRFQQGQNKGQGMFSINDIRPRGGMTQSQAALAEAVRAVNGQSVNGTFRPEICEVASSHLDWMSENGTQFLNGQGHPNFNQRIARLQSYNFSSGWSEITAESYPGQSFYEAAKSCVDGWLKSDGHRGTLKSHQNNFCYDMKYSPRTGRYYCIGLFAH